MSNLDILLGKPSTNEAINTDNTLCVIGENIKLLEAKGETYLNAYKSLINTRFEDGGKSATIVAAILREAGLRGGATTVANHRNALCICPKSISKEN